MDSMDKNMSLALFQFHKGTIRTMCSEVPSLVVRDFNSIKVRLELGTHVRKMGV